MINMPGSPEMMVILVVALIFLGPKELPKVMRTIGNVMAEVRKVSSGFQSEMRNAMDSLTDSSSSSSTAPKPQSGTMTAVTASAETSADDGSAGDQEVVARAADPAATSVDASVVAAAADGAPEASVTGPASDPAARAAG